MITVDAFGDRAVLINFEQKIALDINRNVIQLAHYLRSKRIQGWKFISPAYCSITIGFDPLVWNMGDVIERVNRYLDKAAHIWQSSIGRSMQIPVCYEGSYALDMAEIRKQTGLSESEVVDLHTAPGYQVFMTGFLPGFPYLGILNEKLRCERKADPRLRVPAQSVAIAGLQTGIYPNASPGGWQIIGRVPFKIFDPLREDPFLFREGDMVRFYPVSSTKFVEISKAVAEDHSEIQKVYA